MSLLTVEQLAASSSSLMDSIIVLRVHELSTQGSKNVKYSLREQAVTCGPQALSSADLLKLILCTGAGTKHIGEQIEQFLSNEGLHSFLQSDSGLLKTHFGEIKAVQLEAIFELVRRLQTPPHEKYKIRTPAEAAQLLMPQMSFLDHEEIRVLVLDTRSQVVANIGLYKGSVNSSVVRAAEVFRPAIVRNCPGVLVCHNHPSGDPSEGPEDREMTKQLVAAGKLLEIELVDHLIVAHGRFISLKDKLKW